jgi:hypothetical protein
MLLNEIVVIEVMDELLLLLMEDVLDLNLLLMEQ